MGAHANKHGEIAWGIAWGIAMTSPLRHSKPENFVTGFYQWFHCQDAAHSVTGVLPLAFLR